MQPCIALERLCLAGQIELLEQRSLSEKWDHIPKSKPRGPRGTHSWKKLEYRFYSEQP